MATVGVDVDNSGLYRWTRRLSRLVNNENQQPLGVVLNSSDEPCELSKLSHVDNMISITLSTLVAGRGMYDKSTSIFRFRHRRAVCLCRRYREPSRAFTAARWTKNWTVFKSM